MSTLTDVVAALKANASLKAKISSRVFTRLPEDIQSQVPFVHLQLIAGPPFQNGVGKIVATAERWRCTLWGIDEAAIDGMVGPLQGALLDLWGSYEVQFLDIGGDIDPDTRLAFRIQDVRLIGCV